MAAPVRGISALLLAVTVAAGVAVGVSTGRASRITAPVPNLLADYTVEEQIADSIETWRMFLHSTCGTPVAGATFDLILAGPAAVPHMVTLLESDAEEDVVLHGFAMEVLRGLGEEQLAQDWCERRPQTWGCEPEPGLGVLGMHSLSRPSGKWTGHVWYGRLRQPAVLRASKSGPLRLTLCVGLDCRRSEWVSRTGARLAAQFGGDIMVTAITRDGEYVTGSFAGKPLSVDRSDLPWGLTMIRARAD